jgi:hypothetical protein
MKYTESCVDLKFWAEINKQPLKKIYLLKNLFAILFKKFHVNTIKAKLIIDLHKGNSARLTVATKNELH